MWFLRSVLFTSASLALHNGWALASQANGESSVAKDSLSPEDAAQLKKLKNLKEALQLMGGVDMNTFRSIIVASKAQKGPQGQRGRRRLQSKTSARRLDMGGSDLVLDHMWLLICGTFVMFMHAGFGMLEAGTCRDKNVQTILMKNLITVTVGTVGWWLLGWSFAYGGDEKTAVWSDGSFEDCEHEGLGCGDGYNDNGFFGGKLAFAGGGFLGVGENATKAWAEGTIDPIKYGSGAAYMWFFQWAFATAASTIVSGGVAERVNFPAYAIYSFMMSSIIYPGVVASTWGYGFLETWVRNPDDNSPVGGYIDFAGSGVVHLTGGVSALVGALVVGARSGRFDPDVDQDEFDPHNMPLVVLGTFILWMGWYGFNPGSTLGMSDNATALKAALVAMNTTLSAASGGLTVFTARYFTLGRKYDLGGLCNGILAGLVSITAGCSNVEGGSAFLIGIIGGFCYMASSFLVKKFKIDDVVDAFSVHGACGTWGVIAAALFDFGAGTDKHHGWGGWSATSYEVGGETKYMTTADALGANLCEVAFAIGWGGGLSFIVFFVLNKLKILRIEAEIEAVGADAGEMASKLGYRSSSADNLDAIMSKATAQAIKVNPAPGQNDAAAGT